MNRVILNFALLPEAEFSRQLVEVSRAMGGIEGVEYVLGSDSLPHVTVLQFAALESEAASIWAVLGPVRTARPRGHFHGLAFERWRAWDGIWSRMKHHAGLRRLQAEAATLLPDRTFENGQGDHYEPHATLAAWPKRDHMPMFPLFDHVLEQANVELTPALGISGPQFQFARRLF